MKARQITSCALLAALLSMPTSILGETPRPAADCYDPLWFATAIPPRYAQSPAPTQECPDAPLATPEAPPAQTPAPTMTVKPTLAPTMTVKPTLAPTMTAKPTLAPTPLATPTISPSA